MSPRVRFGAGLLALIALGVWALWLVNIPLWAALLVGAVSAGLIGFLIRWISQKRRDRQKTEA
jgi:plastocyanin domain-containing protein